MLTPIKIMEKLKAPDYEDEPFDDSTFPPKSEDALQRENNTLMQDEAYFKNLICLLISTRDPYSLYHFNLHTRMIFFSLKRRIDRLLLTIL